MSNQTIPPPATHFLLKWWPKFPLLNNKLVARGIIKGAKPAVLAMVKAGLDEIKDHRVQSGNFWHTLGDTLMRAFAMFHLKDPSLLVFRQRLDERWSNMERVYKIRSVARDTAMRQAWTVFRTVL